MVGNNNIFVDKAKFGTFQYFDFYLEKLHAVKLLQYSTIENLNTVKTMTYTEFEVNRNPSKTLLLK